MSHHALIHVQVHRSDTCVLTALQIEVCRATEMPRAISVMTVTHVPMNPSLLTTGIITSHNSSNGRPDLQRLRVTVVPVVPEDVVPTRARAHQTMANRQTTAHRRTMVQCQILVHRTMARQVMWCHFASQLTPHHLLTCRQDGTLDRHRLILPRSQSNAESVGVTHTNIRTCVRLWMNFVVVVAIRVIFARLSHNSENTKHAAVTVMVSAASSRQEQTFC